MIPAFALTLSFDGISLLRRVPGGWALVGDVALDAADLRGALADLRTEADTLSSVGGQVKLVLPNEQIKYLSIPDTGLTGDALQDDIKSALDGATPYDVADLNFDWSRSDGKIHIAAVANETLDEAEAFAKSHHFDPVCFVAKAPEDEFDGEVFFGPAASWTGDAPARADTAMTIVEAPADEVTVADPEEIEPSFADLVEDSDAHWDEALSDLDGATPSEPELDASPTEDEERDEALAPGAASDPPETPTRPVLAATEPATPTAPSFASIRASRGTPTAAPLAPPVPETTPDTPKPRFKLGGARKSTMDSDVTASSIELDAPAKPKALPDRKGAGFFSRRKPAEAAPVAEPPVAVKDPAPSTEAKPQHDPGPARAAVARIAAMRAGRDPDKTSAQGAAPIPDERQRMTVFGARSDAQQIGGKPRFLGLMLTSALLVFLLAVAAWASVFLDEGISRFFDAEDDTPSIARLPDVELLPIDGSVTAPPEDDETVQLAALDTGEDLQTDGALSDVVPPTAALSPEEAAARYAATGIWQRSPTAPAAPGLTTLDDLYVASIDSKVEQFDAVALPSAQVLRNDDTYLSQPNPPLPGTRYTLNPQGLVIATPEGTVNPEGVRVFAGLPPVVPPARPSPPDPERLPEAEAEDTATAAALQAFRPQPRPDGLIEGSERVQLGGFTRSELAAFRPNLRPETLKAQEEEAQPEATQYAVAQSVEPVTRPRDFSRIVARALELRQSQPQEATQIAAVAPRVVQPRIPSTANVARQATVRNAINLRRINLIGVYGKSSNRRALVRLGNGRYQKVQVGDRLDGGRVAAIGTSELRYTKNGRNVVLGMPDG